MVTTTHTHTHTHTPYLTSEGRDENGGHVETGLIQPWPLAQLLRDLHQHPLSITLCACSVNLAQIEVDSVRMDLIESL